MASGRDEHHDSRLPSACDSFLAERKEEAKMIRVFVAVCTAAVASLTCISASSQGFTIDEALSAPFASGLVGSPQTGCFAWAEDQQGRRNLWIAKPDRSGNFESKRLTSYDQDDGQEIYQIRWTPDAEHLVYVRGGDSEFPGKPDPNPALAPDGVVQSIWLIAAAGKEPRKLGEGYDPAVSPAGDRVAFLSSRSDMDSSSRIRRRHSKAAASHPREYFRSGVGAGRPRSRLC